jgi:hypothetical protein
VIKFTRRHMKQTMTIGYIYCFSNPAMPGLLKIGYTERPVEQRLEEANLPNTWGPPMPYMVEFAKLVREPNAKEQIIHKLLHDKRVNPKREFFRVTVEHVRLLFDLVDGTSWDADGGSLPEPAPAEQKDDVLHQFLDKHIYPPNEDGQTVPWTHVAAAFQTWKRENGITRGDAMKLRELLIAQYGKPNRGEGWTGFRLQTPRRNSVIVKL